LGLWIAETESAKYWLTVLTEIRWSKGFIITSDDLPGIREAITSVYPSVAYQGCVVHVIRNSNVSWKDMKAFCSDMKFISIHRRISVAGIGCVENEVGFHLYFGS